jgi:hypothetical protein
MVWPATLPPGYIMPEEMVGACLALPVHFAGWISVGWIWRRRRDPAVSPLALAVVAGAAASLLATAIMLCWLGATSRYLTEITGGWTLASCVGLMILLTPEQDSKAHRIRPRACVAVALMCWSVAIAWLASFEHGSVFRYGSPLAYSRIAKVLDYPSQWIARARGLTAGPVELTLAIGPYKGPETMTLLATGRLNMRERLELARRAPEKADLTLLENDSPVAQIRDLPLDAGELKLRVEAPWLYPPREHPFWEQVADASERRDRQTRFALTTPFQSATGYSGLAFDATGLTPEEPVNHADATVRIVGLQHLSHLVP